MKYLFSLLTVVFAVLVFLVSCGGSEPGSIYGVVTDKATGEPIKNAGIELLPVGLKTVTGSDGSFEFLDISSGHYNLLVTKTGYKDTKSDIITVESGKAAHADVHLEKNSALRIVDDAGKEKDEIDFGAEISDISRQFNIFNNGEEKLNWQISYSADWIKEVRPDEGELKAFGTQGVIVTIDRSLLESGEQTTTINVTSNDGNKELTVKATNATVLPTLNTLEATSVDTDSAVLNGEILTAGVPEYTERGFVYSTSSLPTTENTIEKLTAPLNDDVKYSVIATGLELGTTYYVRAYAINAAGIAYSTNVVSFKPHQVPPELKTEDPTNISVSSGTATFKGTIKYEGDPVYTERGFVYGHSHNPTVEDDTKKEVAGYGEGAFSIKVTELEINTIYYIRAYAINEAGIGYGNEVMLDFNAVKPIVYTKEVTNVSIEGGMATFNGSIESVGDPAYTERGFVYATVHNPTVEDDTKKVVSGTGTGAFFVNITDLAMNNIYYIRAYAINSQGTTYGEEVKLNFSQIFPVVTTKAVSDMEDTTATFNGIIEKIGDPSYTERGFIYGKMPVPTIDDANALTITASGTGYGAFAHSVNNLETGATYYVRAYAKVGTIFVYGEVVNFIAEIPPYVTLTNGLVVAKEDAGKIEWFSAYSLCATSTLGGLSNWHLPTLADLLTLYNNKDLIGNFQDYRYWSASDDGHNNVFSVDFTDGEVNSHYYSNSSNKYYVRCVRTAE